MVYPQMPPFTNDELESFLKEAPIARFSTANEDGTIHTVPVWYRYENGELLLGTQDVTRKVRNVKRDNKVTVLIDIPGPPLKGVVIYGRAQLDYENPIPKRVSIFERYMPRDKAQALAQGLANLWKLVIVRVKPEKIISYDYGKDPTGMFK